MSRELDERMCLAALAHRRYPDMPLMLALECFNSDRRRAGLGALEEKRRETGRRLVKIRKSSDPMNGSVLYDMCINLPARVEIEMPSFKRGNLGELLSDFSASFVKTISVPARSCKKCVSIERNDLRTQRGRNLVANILWKMRKEMRHDMLGKS